MYCSLDLERAKHETMHYLLTQLLSGGCIGDYSNDRNSIHYIHGGHSVTNSEYLEIITTAKLMYKKHPRRVSTHKLNLTNWLN